MTIWYYEFKDGSRYELLNTGFSIADLMAFEKIHGKCVDNGYRRV